MAVGDAYVFPGFLTPVLTQLFFQKPPTTFLTCFCRGERQNYAGKKSRELKKKAVGKHCGKRRKCWLPSFSPFFSTVFSKSLSPGSLKSSIV